MSACMVGKVDAPANANMIEPKAETEKQKPLGCGVAQTVACRLAMAGPSSNPGSTPGEALYLAEAMRTTRVVLDE
jgi:hypothetical protein